MRGNMEVLETNKDNNPASDPGVAGQETSKRRMTRKALLTAARDLVFIKGHDRISVQEITGRAKVGTGTYYNYFETKQDVFVAIAEDMQRQIAESLQESRDAINDPATKVAVTLKYYFTQALDNQDWREFIACVGLNDICLQQAPEQLRADIERGVKAGRFRIDDIHFTQHLIEGMITHVTRGMLKGDIGRNSIERCVRSILQMLGLPDLVTKALTQTPLPPIAAPRHRPAAAKPAQAVQSNVAELPQQFVNVKDFSR